ncbi:MAG: hypothetical protein EOO38_15215 [Cytophagaceae bacterium]|nr:MAG: hypothetical protein EOO38_15215 [Cytophagaceae bacterium]
MVPLIVLRQKLVLLTDEIDVCCSAQTDEIEDFRAKAKALIGDCSIYGDSNAIKAIEPRWLRSHAVELRKRANVVLRKQNETLSELQAGIADG